MKKPLALLLAVTMIVGLVVPGFAYEKYANPNYKVAIVGTEIKEGDAVVGVEIDFQVQGDSIAGSQGLLLKYDAKKMKLVSYSQGIDVPIPNTGTINSIEFYDDSIFVKPGFMKDPSLSAKKAGDWV